MEPNNDKPKILYHYTTNKGKDGIVKNKKINKSVEKKGRADVRHGEGVYLTELTPKTAKEEIAKNNYDGKQLDKTVAKFIKNGFIDYYIEIKLKKDKLSKLEKCTDTAKRLIAMNRNVWLYKDDDIDLSKDVDSWEWGETGASEAISEQEKSQASKK